MPLNIKFRNYGIWGIIIAVIINLVLVGLWHGANMTFAIFGLYHGLLFIPLILSGDFMKKSKLRVNEYGLPKLVDFGKMLGTYLLVSFGLIIFVARDMFSAINYISHMFISLGIIPDSIDTSKVFGSLSTLLLLCLSLSFTLIVEWRNRNKEYGLLFMQYYGNKSRYLIYILLCLVVLFFNGDAKDFIYVQF